MDPAAVRGFVERDWERKAALKRRYWAERYRREGARATLEASRALREHLEIVRPDWPTAEDRAADLRHHQAFIAMLARAAHAFADR
jgi:hypothetical protein